MKSRLDLPAPGQMTTDQQAVYDDVVRTRGNAHGPFLAWLLNPKLAQPAQQLGGFCRYGTALSLAESELLILLIAARYDCSGEQQIHEPIALKAGLDAAAIEDIRQGRAPQLGTHKLQMLVQIALELLRTSKLSEPSYEKAVREFGETTLVEIVAIIGY
jgi:4-carboxymuconolactone decarboxylase